MDSAPSEKVPLRVQYAVYASGVFSNSMSHMVAVVVPLWVLTLEPSAFLIGVVLGSRHFLPLVLSIHGGALMDRLGARRIMVFFALIGAVVPVLFPVLPWIPAVILLQMLSGLSASMGWVGAQTLIGQAMKGNPTYAGRLSFSLRIGTLTGPPVAGAAWDLLGPWGAFLTLSLWGAGLFAASLTLPAPAASITEAKTRLEVGDLVPKLSDYVAAFKLLAIPAIALVIMVTALRISGNGIQASFYVIYLEGIGVSGTAIGLLLAAASLLGGAGALVAGPVARIVKPYWLLLVTVAGSIILIAITPVLGTFFLLLVASGLRGGTMGMSQPLMISILSRAAGPEAQGKSVGLRTTANRLASSVVPIVMGGVVEVAGLEASFLIVGAVLVLLLALLALHVKRSAAFAD